MFRSVLFLLVSTVFVYAGVSDINKGSLGGYFTYKEVLQMIETLQQDYPDLISTGFIGETDQGRSIPYLKLSMQSNYNLGDVSLKGNLLISAGMYTSQPLSVSQSLYNIQSFIKDLDTVDIRMVLKKTNIWVVPMINIDSFELFAQHYSSEEEFIALYKNQAKTCDDDSDKNGINLNRNFESSWKEDLDATSDGCDKSYKGDRPFQANETSAIREFISDKEISIWIDYDG